MHCMFSFCFFLWFYCFFIFFFFKQKTAYEMRISDWSSDLCSSDLHPGRARRQRLSGLRERFHANRRHAIDQDLEAIVTHDIAADTIDLLPEHPWLGSEMTLHQRARRWIEED